MVSVLIAFSVVSGVTIPINAYENLDKIQEKTAKESNKLVSGIYSIDTRINGLSLEPGVVQSTGEEAVLTNTKEDKNSQKWFFSETTKGAFTIVSAVNGKALTAEYKDDLDDAVIKLADYNDDLSQKWVFKKDDDGFYSIHSCVSSDYVLQYGNPKGIMISKSTKNIYQTFKLDFVRETMQPSEIKSSVENVSVDSVSSENGTFNVCLNGIESNAMITGLKVEVRPEGKNKKSKVYYAQSDDYENFSQTIRAADFNYASGEYEVKLTLELEGVYFSEIGTYTCNVTDPFKGMEKRITRYISENTGANESWQVSFMDLTRNKEISINSKKDLSMNVIKLFVMGAVYDSYNELCEKSSKETINTALQEMIILDSDIALGNLFYLLGDGNYDDGANIVTKWANDQGYEEVVVSTQYTEDYCSAENASQFMADLYAKKYKKSEDMLSLLEQQGTIRIITSIIPSDVKTGSKAGMMGVTINDSAIIYSPNGDYVLTVMSTGVSSASYTQAIIQNISQEFYSFLND